MSEEQSVLLSGHVYFAEDTKPFKGTLRVFLEDVGRMDTSAPILAEHTQENFQYTGEAVPYRLKGRIPPSGGQRFNVRVHVSRDGSDEFKKGDYITTESYPALTPGGPSHVDVKVQEI